MVISDRVRLRSGAGSRFHPRYHASRHPVPVPASAMATQRPSMGAGGPTKDRRRSRLSLWSWYVPKAKLGRTLRFQLAGEAIHFQLPVPAPTRPILWTKSYRPQPSAL